MKKLLLIGSNSIHVYNYEKLISSYFDEVLLLSDKVNSDYNIKTIAIDFSLKYPLNYITTVSKIKKVIREFNPSIIHIHQANSYAFYTLKASQNFNIPKVLTTWGSDILLLPQKNILLNRIVKYNLRQATAITADALFMAEEMRKLVSQKKLDITIANFGIDIVPSSLPKENIIYSNRLHNNLYRIDCVIKAFYKFSKTEKGSNWKLIIAANGDKTEQFKKMVSELKITDKVEFFGWVDKKQNFEFYARAKLFVSIPESDATAMSLLEAMSYRCLPVVSNLPANKEWITNGVSGIIVDNINEDFFSKALLLNFEKATEINTAIIQQKATKEVNRKKFLDLYDRLLNIA